MPQGAAAYAAGAVARSRHLLGGGPRTLYESCAGQACRGDWRARFWISRRSSRHHPPRDRRSPPASSRPRTDGVAACHDDLDGGAASRESGRCPEQFGSSESVHRLGCGLRYRVHAMTCASYPRSAAKEWAFTRTRRPAPATVCRRVLLPGVGSDARAHSMRSDLACSAARAQRYFVYAQLPSLSARGRRRSAAVRPLPLLPYEHVDAAPGCSFVTRGQLGALADAVVDASIKRLPAQSCTARSILAHVEPIAHAELTPSRGEIHAAFATAGGQPCSAEGGSPRPDLRALRAIARLAVSLSCTPTAHALQL